LLALCDEYSASVAAKAAADVLSKNIESYGSKRPKELGEISPALGQGLPRRR